MNKQERIIRAQALPAGITEREQYALYFLLVAYTHFQKEIGDAIVANYDVGNPADANNIANVEARVKTLLTDPVTGLYITDTTKYATIFKLLQPLWKNGNNLRSRLMENGYGTFVQYVGDTILQLNYGPPPCPVGTNYDLSTAWYYMTVK